MLLAVGTCLCLQGQAPPPATKTAVVGPGPLAWNNANSWIPSGVPKVTATVADDVLIPAGANIAMDGACVAGTVRVEGMLGAAAQNGSLSARWVMVTGSRSLLHVGMAGAPFQQSFTIELNATDETENILGAGTKFLMAMDGGTIELHGAPKKSWTKLDGVLGNGTAIVVEDLTNWQVGDSIVIAYTGHVNHASPANLPLLTYNPYSGPSSQVRQITAISPTTRTIQISAPIKTDQHCAAPPTIHLNTPGTRRWTLDQRAEVGMLTHNIVVRGAATSSRFGAHVMLMACCTQMPPGTGRFEHVEFTEVGQQRVLGRYPVHWHMQRDSGLGQYVRHSSIHKTYNRAVTLHGSHKVVVEGNVCHDVTGHAVFLEDGVERGNQILRNLVLAVRKPAQCEAMLLHDNALDRAQDRSPAAFWISHPDNQVIGNVAADSLGVGYWFALHTAPTGLSMSTTPPQNWRPSFSSNGTPWNASRESLGAFQGNVSHSMKMGIDIHDTIVEEAP